MTPGLNKQVVVPIVGILLATLLVALGVHVADWKRVGDAMKGADARFVLLSVPFLVGTLVLFAARWGQMIAAEPQPPFRDLFSFLMIGYLANAVLPARPGDLIRVALLRSKYRVEISHGLASLVLERLVDLSAVCGVGVVLSFLVPLPPILLSGIYAVALCVFGSLAILLLASRHRDEIPRFVEAHPRLLGARFARYFADSLVRFVFAVHIASSPRRFAMSVALTALGWALLAAFMMSMVAAFGLPVPLSAGLLVLIGTNLGALLPLSPGAIGVWHFMAVLALALWGIDSSTAIAFAIGSHAIATGLHISIGLMCTWREGIRFATLANLRKANDANM